jgi:hypothetical protein
MAVLLLAALQIDGHRMAADVQKLASFRTRYVGSSRESEEGVGAAARWIMGELDRVAKSTRAELGVHEFQIGKIPARNVFLRIPGRNPGRVVVFGAHYDSINTAERRADPDAPAPGANDNASGASAVLELARALGARTFESTVILVAFSGEELGLLGARAFVQFLREQNLEVAAMINNDIIGSSRASDGSRRPSEIRCFSAGPESSPSRWMARWAKAVVEEKIPGTTILVQDRIDRPGRGGDHQPFSDAGIRAIRLMEAVEDLDRQHNRRDLPDLIDPAYLARVASADAMLIEAAANTVEGEAPLWILTREGRVVEAGPGDRHVVCARGATGLPGLPSAEVERR